VAGKAVETQPSPRTVPQGTHPHCVQGGRTRTAGGASTPGETLANQRPLPRHRGRTPLPRAGLSLGILGVQGPHGPEQVQPWDSVQTATSCSQPGWSRMCPRLLSQPRCTAARVRGASLELGGMGADKAAGGSWEPGDSYL